jgi:hypothetical protein
MSNKEKENASLAESLCDIISSVQQRQQNSLPAAQLDNLNPQDFGSFPQQDSG